MRERRHKMTFRLPADLAAGLRHLPNQTAFVETALRYALGRVCPLCHGTGETPYARLNVSDLKHLIAGPLDRAAAARLKALVRLGRELLATDLALEARPDDVLDFRLERESQVLLTGQIPRGSGPLTLTH